MAEKYSTLGFNLNLIWTSNQIYYIDFRARLENFFLESETELVALELESSAEGGVAAEEDRDLPPLLLPDLGEDFVPVGAAGIGPGLEASHQISFFLE